MDSKSQSDHASYDERGAEVMRVCHFLQKVQRYHDRELQDAEHPEVEAHIAVCECCRRELAELVHLREGFREIPQQELSTQALLLIHQRLNSQPGRFSFALIRGLAVAAMLLLVVNLAVLWQTDSLFATTTAYVQDWEEIAVAGEAAVDLEEESYLEPEMELTADFFQENSEAADE